MAGPTVTLTFAGDSKSLERTFDKVGTGAKKMGSDFDKAGGDAKRFGHSMDSVNESVDKSEGKFTGAADLLDGLGGAFGLPTDGAVGMARSFADLASGFASVLGPAITGVLTKIGVLTTATSAEAVATEGAAAAQTSLNLAFLANPVGLVIAGIVALGAAFVVAWKNSETFRDIVKGALDAVGGAVTFVKNLFVGAFNWVKDNWPLLLAILTGPFGLAVAAVVKFKDQIVQVADAIAAPFRAAFGAIKTAWNSTLGGFGFEFGGWDPPGPGSIPGISFKIPSMHQGGVVPGPLGAEVPILALAGETVTPAGQAPAGGPVSLRVFIDGREIHQSLLRLQRTSGPLGLA